jgi:hypothetical protein
LVPTIQAVYNRGRVNKVFEFSRVYTSWSTAIKSNHVSDVVCPDLYIPSELHNQNVQT